MRHPSGHRGRRQALRWLGCGLLGFVLPGARAEGVKLEAKLRESLLQESAFAYISPRTSAGEESSCHGEVWFSWIDGHIVIVTSRRSWKFQALARGLDQAYIWLGDYGRWKGWFGRKNWAFKRATRFQARATESRDPILMETLMTRFGNKYPAEFSDWEHTQRSDFANDERTLLRYELI